MLLEKKVFLSAFAMRKLIDDCKLTDNTKEHSILCRVYKPRGTRVDIMNWHRIDDHYDMSSEQSSSIKMRFLANQIIHSLVFMFEASEEEHLAAFTGFIVTSDLRKDKYLYGVTFEDYLSAMRLIGNDWVVERRATRTKDGWDIRQR